MYKKRTKIEVFQKLTVSEIPHPESEQDIGFAGIGGRTTHMLTRLVGRIRYLQLQTRFYAIIGTRRRKPSFVWVNQFAGIS